jgi:hypothetical protein
MRRYAGPLVIVATMAVLAGLVLLWRSISADTAPATAAPRTTEAEPGAPSLTQPSGVPAMRAPERPALAPRGPAAPTLATGGGPAGAPAVDGDGAAPATKANTKNLEWGLTQMRAQVAANEPKVVECLAQAAATGDKPSGDATLTFIAARRGDKIVIEDTSVDHDATTIASEPLLECLHATSKSMTFAGLPREAEAVFITRTVKVDAGGLVENKLVKFSYIR